ncbi:LPD29 domain-containing protein [Carboxylicivirga sp. RSCT41]|uniref:LPD29 domain-containing protein n=1 Tax=Carboxylicivirga agarovorans TaxID=3417570 RepID=UPI003D324C44
MAYINKQEAAEIRKEIKVNFPSNEGWKISVVIDNHSSLDISIMTAPFDLEAEENEERANKVKDQLKELGKGKEWFDKSDIMTDYFHVKHYVFVRVGKWDKPFQVVEPKAKKSAKKAVKVEAPVVVDYTLIEEDSLANTYEPIEATEEEEVVVEVVAVVEDDVDYWSVLDQSTPTEKEVVEVVEKQVAPTNETDCKALIDAIIKEDNQAISKVYVALFKGFKKIGYFKTISAAKKISSYLGSGAYNLVGQDGFKYNDSFYVSTQ